MVRTDILDRYRALSLRIETTWKRTQKGDAQSLE